MKIRNFFKQNIGVILTTISFLALVFITMPASKIGVKHTILLLIIGPIVIIWKKLRIKDKDTDKASLLCGLGTAIYFGFAFYKRWRSLSRLKPIAALLHMPQKVLVIIAGVILSVWVVYFLIGMYYKLRKAFNELKQTNPLKKDLFCILLLSIMVVFVPQIMIGLDILSMGWFRFIWNILIAYVSQLLIYCLFGKVQISFILGTFAFMIISTVNRYVYDFRARLFEPVDILSAGTAMNVADNYSLFPIPFDIIIGWVFWLILVFGAFKVSSGEKHKLSGKNKLKMLACCVLSIALIFGYTQGLKPCYWEKQGAQFNGYILDFVSKLKEIYPEKPKEYSDKAVENLADKYNTNSPSSSKEKQPHIIVIMDEAFSDLSILGNLSTNKEVAPFISNLKQDAISGYALASVYGGNTANSEYELITGNTMAWLTPNTVPYQRYINDSTYSMVSYLKANYGYNCIAMHPYLSTGWNRPAVYPSLGFDEMLFQEDFPQKNLIRKYISDQEMFEKIIETYENKQTDPLFLFGVTMQNHGNYYYSGSNFSPTISLKGYKNGHSDVEQYLSLIHETDKAVENLITYFSKAEEEVVIMFFGDHQPKLNNSFYDEISNGNQDSLEWQQKMHMVPFFVWANYDIEEKEVECVSLNYLSSYIYDAAGIPLPPYNKFLADMENTIPAINANGFFSKKSNRFLTFEEASEDEQKWLDDYKVLQYNSMFDEKNQNQVFFKKSK